MYARMTKFVGLPPERVDQALEEFKVHELALFDGREGFEGVIVLVDRAAGTAAALSLWDDEEHMKATEAVAREARRGVAAMTKPERTPIVDHYLVYEVHRATGDVEAHPAT